MKEFLLLLFVFYPFTFSFAEMYKWVDEDGNINYGDSCPLPACETQSIKAAPRPTDEQIRQSRQRLENLKQRTQRLEEMRKEKASQKQQEKEEKWKKRVETKKQCAHARQNLHVLQQRRPAYSIDDKGEYIFIEDDARTREIENLEQFISQHCE